MKITLDRAWKKPTYTISRVYVNSSVFCNIIEDTDRDLKQTDPLPVIKMKKVYGETAIPKGTYLVDMDTISPKYAGNSFYKSVCGGKVPRLIDVPGFEGVLIHCGNTALDSYGCLIVGVNTVKGMVTQSRETFKKLYKVMSEAHKRGETITVEIK